MFPCNVIYLLPVYFVANRRYDPIRSHALLFIGAANNSFESAINKLKISESEFVNTVQPKLEHNFQ
jgi:hypothetical protein